MEAVAKEVGMNKVTLANVILVVEKKKATKGAETYRRQMEGKNRVACTSSCWTAHCSTKSSRTARR